GRLLHSTQITQSTTTISTATYPNGIYYCQLLDNGHITATQKLVIIK
ncbi:MAG: T9SS type A sorting domain-containing protein, partial [Sphingobacteriales bacterium]|nr:T9SS type A sorting domain-containing protein [Sphingobacteriales bacterium]